MPILKMAGIENGNEIAIWIRCLFLKKQRNGRFGVKWNEMGICDQRIGAERGR